MCLAFPVCSNPSISTFTNKGGSFGDKARDMFPDIFTD